MPRLSLTPQDVLRSKILKPGIYTFEVSAVNEETNKAGDAQNIVVDFVGVEGMAQGVPVRVWFSEKAPGMAVPFIKALGGSVSETESTSFEFAQATGRKVRLQIENEKYMGKLQNTVAGYAPVAG